MPEATETVAPRKDPKKVDIYSRSRGNELAKRDPKFHYALKPRDQKHPDSVVKKLVPHEIGDQMTGFAMVDAWEVVRPGEAKQGAKRADDASGSLDGAEGHGDQIWIKTPIENYAKYEAIESLRLERQTKAFQSGERAGNRLVNSKAIIHSGFAEDGAHDVATNELLERV
jgi:hypothetical protein